jgi:hypothetical protein
MQMPLIYPIALSGPVASFIPHQFFDLGSLIPSGPVTTVEYDWILKKPSANDVCDGALTIYAWLHLTDRIVYDTRTTFLVERWMLPQKFVVKYELDTHVENEVEYCPTWRGVPKDRLPKMVKGFEYNHVMPVTIDEDPPNTDGEKMESTTTFRWVRDLASLGSITSPGGLITPPINIQLGLGHADYAGNVHWILDLKSNLSEYDGIVQESAVIYEDPALTEDFFCHVASEDNSASYRRGEGEAMFTAGFRENNRVITTP